MGGNCCSPGHKAKVLFNSLHSNLVYPFLSTITRRTTLPVNHILPHQLRIIINYSSSLSSFLVFDIKVHVLFRYIRHIFSYLSSESIITFGSFACSSQCLIRKIAWKASHFSNISASSAVMGPPW